MQGVPRQDLCGLLFKELWSEDEVGSMSMGSIRLAIRVYKYKYIYTQVKTGTPNYYNHYSRLSILQATT